MRPRCACGARCKRLEEASLLVEVLVGIALVGIIVVPLATGIQSAMKRADGLFGRAEALYAAEDLASGSDAWTWGQAVESVTWEVGPVLRATVRQDAGEEARVGLWVDGWLLGEWETGSSGEIVVGAAEWTGRAGGELVLRARRSEGCWGPPSRSIVPDAYCDIPGQQASRDWATGLLDGPGDGHMVAHVPGLGNPALSASWTDEPVTESVLGLTFLLPCATSGYCELSFDGDVQSWNNEEGRALDVYF